MRISFSFWPGRVFRFNGFHIRGSAPKFVLGIIFFLFGSFFLWQGFNSKIDGGNNYLKTTGQVVNYERSEGFYREIIEYEVNGVKYVLYSSSYTERPRSIGTTVKVKYNPYIPSQAIVDNSSGRTVIFVIGGIFVVIGGIFLFIRFKSWFSDDDEFYE